MHHPVMILSAHLSKESGTERKSLSLIASKKQEGRSRELLASQFYLDT